MFLDRRFDAIQRHRTCDEDTAHVAPPNRFLNSAAGFGHIGRFQNRRNNRHARRARFQNLADVVQRDPANGEERNLYLRRDLRAPNRFRRVSRPGLVAVGKTGPTPI